MTTLCKTLNLKKDKISRTFILDRHQYDSTHLCKLCQTIWKVGLDTISHIMIAINYIKCFIIECLKMPINQTTIKYSLFFFSFFSSLLSFYLYFFLFYFSPTLFLPNKVLVGWNSEITIYKGSKQEKSKYY